METRKSSMVGSTTTTTTTTSSFFRRQGNKKKTSTGRPLLKNTTTKSSSRVARLASMLSNTSSQQQKQKHNNNIPSSPVSSDHSSSFVAWPGTMDTRGRIVQTASSSFEDTASSIGGSGVCHFRVNLEHDLERASSQHVQSWISQHPIPSKLNLVRDEQEQQQEEAEQVYSNANAADFALAEIVAQAARTNTRQKQQQRSTTTSTAPLPPPSSSSIANGSSISMTDLFDKRHNWEPTPAHYGGSETSFPTPTTTTTITREALEKNDSLFSTPLYGKFQVPNLMDQVESDSFCSSSRATSTYTKPTVSDVFDGIVDSDFVPPQRVLEEHHEEYEDEKENTTFEEDEEEQLNVVVLPSGLVSIQTRQVDFDARHTSREYDETLTNSEVDQYGFIKLPAFESPSTLLQQQRTESSESSSFSEEDEEDVDWSVYQVSPQATKKLVRAFRYFSEVTENTHHDVKRAFALSEMRSRILHADLERSLERRGGTVVCDDLVLTPHVQASLRIRDAVLVAKAWRDGASPRDVVTASCLTRPNCDYCVERYDGQHAYLELVEWMDDVDFMQYKCPSLGPRCMRGFEMFTIGDCQSILLKLTNERCVQLRGELFDATALQIEAEEIMKQEEEFPEIMSDSHGIMTQAEMTYLTSMEQVKALSKQLVVAERAFHLVRDRIEQLVAKYETLLVRLENEDSLVEAAPSSVITLESSNISTDFEDYEKQILARRAQRAEIKAELVAREAMLAKQQAQQSLQEKERELEELQQRLLELQSEPSHVFPEREHSVILAKAIAANSGHHSPSSFVDSSQNRTTQQDEELAESLYQEKISSVKQKFRDRMAERKNSKPAAPSRNQVLSGEEMFQYLDFYERSLKAVEQQQEDAVPEYRHSA